MAVLKIKKGGEMFRFRMDTQTPTLDLILQKLQHLPGGYEGEALVVLDGAAHALTPETLSQALAGDVVRLELRESTAVQSAAAPSPSDSPSPPSPRSADSTASTRCDAADAADAADVAMADATPAPGQTVEEVARLHQEMHNRWHHQIHNEQLHSHERHLDQQQHHHHHPQHHHQQNYHQQFAQVPPFHHQISQHIHQHCQHAHRQMQQSFQQLQTRSSQLHQNFHSQHQQVQQHVHQLQQNLHQMHQRLQQHLHPRHQQHQQQPEAHAHSSRREVPGAHWSDAIPSEVGGFHVHPLEMHSQRRHLTQWMITGAVRLVNSDLVLDNCMVTGSLHLMGSRVLLRGGMLTGSVICRDGSSFENQGGMVTGQVRQMG